MNWISVKDRLPEDEMVLAWYHDSGEYGYKEPSKGYTTARWMGKFWVTLQPRYGRREITHWMPLPDPPEEP